MAVVGRILTLYYPLDVWSPFNYKTILMVQCSLYPNPASKNMCEIDFDSLEIISLVS